METQVNVLIMLAQQLRQERLRQAEAARLLRRARQARREIAANEAASRHGRRQLRRPLGVERFLGIVRSGLARPAHRR